MQWFKESAVLGEMIPMLDLEWINDSTESLNSFISLLKRLYIVNPSVIYFKKNFLADSLLLSESIAQRQ